MGKSYKLQSCLLKQELKHDEVYEDTWEARQKTGYLMLKMASYQLISVMLDIQWVWKN